MQRSHKTKYRTFSMANFAECRCPANPFYQILSQIQNEERKVEINADLIKPINCAPLSWQELLCVLALVRTASLTQHSSWL